MLTRLPAVVWLFASVLFPISVASASPKHGDVPLSECAAVFERFGHIRLPADTKAALRALKDTRWLSRAVVYQQTILAGWIPILSGLGRPGGVYVIDLSPSVSLHKVGYRIYVHTTRAFSGDAAVGIRTFLAGRAAPEIVIDEYALCYPGGRILHVDRKSRRMTPSAL